MTKQVINVGAAANDKNGDSLRVAFTKVNANFAELYDTDAAGVQIPGPYADDAAAATAGVTVGSLYYKTSGQVFVRLV